MIFHIHLAVIHTFSSSVSCPDCMKLQFRRLHPQIRRVEYTQNRTALLVKGFNSKPKPFFFFFQRLNVYIQIQSVRRGLGRVIPPVIGLLLSGAGMAFYLYSYSVRANCTRTCNIQAGLKVSGTNTHGLVFFWRVVSLICLGFYFTKMSNAKQKRKETN